MGQTITNVGTDFWIAFPPNQDPAATLKIFISSDFNTTGLVSSAYPGVDQSFSVSPGIVTELTVPSGVALLGGTENKGIHIVSVQPVAVYGLNRKTASTDAYLALPVNSLGIDYRIMTYVTSFLNWGSSFSIAATQNGTVLSVYNHQTGITTIVNLDQGQTYHVETGIVGQDLTGSSVQSNFPVAVYGSVELAQVPSGCVAGDHIVEQMWPVSSWGENFATVPLAGRDNSGDIFRVLAATDGTVVTVNGTNVTTLNTGEHYETNLAGYNSITTSQPSCLAQFAKGQWCSGNITGDPLMMLIPPRDQFLTNYTIGTVSGFTSHWVNIVAPSEALGTIYEDGVLIPVGAFTQIGTTNYYGAQRSITEGSHVYQSAFPFGVFVYGWNSADSYGYPGGGSLSPVATVDSISISPDTLYGQLNITSICLTAHVLDNLGSPVEGVLVNFHISGINPILGNAYTNSSGDAQYCYTQTGTTPGVDQVYAEVLGIISDTAIVFWSYIPPCINPVTGGTIGNDQSGCGSYMPSPLVNLALPAGQTGTLEYKWQSSTVSSTSGFTDIPGSNADSYVPGIISQTTWYKRLSRVTCMADWSGAPESNVVTLTVNPVMPVSLTVSASGNNICSGTSVTFTATPVNGGTSPQYQWKVNGINAGTNNPVYTYSPVNNDVITCVLTSNVTCPSGNPATSNPVTMIVNPILPVSVTVAASQNPVCAGTNVTFTATPTNGGTSPMYQWKVNGVNAGTSSPVYSYIPVNGDMVWCTLTSSEQCTSGNPASSNHVSMVVNPYLPVGVSVSASSNPFCPGGSVTFTATPVNGGTSPQYQWKVNGVNAGSNSPVYAYNPTDGDLVWCVLTSSGPCTTGNPASSVQVQMVEDHSLPAGVSVTASSNPFCEGTIVIFTATPVNGGANPAYQWKVNGNNAGTNSPSFSYPPQAGDSIRCIMTSNLYCVSFNPATSGKIVMSSNPLPVVTFTYCFDSITRINGKPIKLKGGIPLGGTYSGPGVNSTTGVFNPSAAGTGAKAITYSYTNMTSCIASKTRTITVVSNPAFTCGSNLTDIRDNKVYPTVLIGSQCWMAADLNYGQELSPSQNQRDNCIPEKYFNPASGSQHPASVYQWDELMRYDDTPGLQGLCPPGWHVPTEPDWNALFTNWTNYGFAGSPLKYSGYSGFNALLSGVMSQNVQWSLQNFATFYWASDPHGETRAWSHGMNDPNPSVSVYSSLRSNAFSVRCLKD